MAKYRKISTHIWNDEKVRDMSDSAKFALVFILTHPHMGPLGAIRANTPGLAHELGWSSRKFAKTFSEITDKGIARYDAKASLIWFPNFLKHNPPESPNVVTSWAGSFEDLPECDLRNDIFSAACAHANARGASFREAFEKAFGMPSRSLPDTLPEGFGEPFPKGMPNQEQEQDKDINTGGEGYCAHAHVATSVPETPLPKDGASSSPQSEPVGPKKTDSPSKGTPEWRAFLSCWEVYPVKQAQEDAWREWMRLKQNRTLAQAWEIRDAILNMTANDSRWLRGKVPKFSNWLRGKSWNDEPYIEPPDIASGQTASSPRALALSGSTRPVARTQYQKGRQDMEDIAGFLMNAERRISNGDKSENSNGAGKNGACLPATTV